MDPLFYIGVCKVCGAGMLQVEYDETNCVPCVRCDECMAIWKTPDEALTGIHGLRDYGNHRSIRRIREDELEKSGWMNYIEKFKQS